MQLLGKGDRLKIPEIGRTGIVHDSSTLASARNLQSTRTLGGRPAKGGNSMGPLGSHRLRGSNFRAKEEEAMERELLKSIQVMTADGQNLRDNFDKSTAAGPSVLRAGALEMDEHCLSCTGVSAHAMELFKVACISYKPSAVHYRNRLLSRLRLMDMRRTLVDKCEEVINGETWPHGGQDLRTGKIFRDLLQFYGNGEHSLSTDPSFVDGPTQPSANASFVPAFNSQRTLNQEASASQPDMHDISFMSRHAQYNPSS